MSNRELITLPFSADVLDAADVLSDIEIANKYALDISTIHFDDPELEKDKVTCSLVYFRNVDIPVGCDFSKSSYEEKRRWLLTYLNADLFDLCVTELNETLLNVFAEEDLVGLYNILSPEETQLFREENKATLDEIRKFIVSLDVVLQAMLDDTDREFFSEVEIDPRIPVIAEKPLFFETLHQLLKHYPVYIDALRLFYDSKFTLCNYKYVLQNIDKSSSFYQDFLKLPSVKFIGVVLNDALTKENSGDM